MELQLYMYLHKCVQNILNVFVVCPFSLYRVFNVSSFFVDTYIFIDCELMTKTLSFMIIAVTPLLLLEATLRRFMVSVIQLCAGWCLYLKLFDQYI